MCIFVATFKSSSSHFNEPPRHSASRVCSLFSFCDRVQRNILPSQSTLHSIGVVRSFSSFVRRFDWKRRAAQPSYKPHGIPISLEQTYQFPADTHVSGEKTRGNQTNYREEKKDKERKREKWCTCRIRRGVVGHPADPPGILPLPPQHTHAHTRTVSRINLNEAIFHTIYRPVVNGRTSSSPPSLPPPSPSFVQLYLPHCMLFQLDVRGQS
jgi:hypothetical protein